MTETAIFPGSVTPDTDQAFGDVDAAESQNRRRLLIAGGAGGVVVLAAAAYFLLHGGSSDNTSFAPVTHSTVSSPAPGHGGTAKAAGKPNPKTLPKKAHVQVRDPFKALVVAPVTSGTSTGTTTVSANGSTTPSTTETAPTTGTVPSTGPTAPTGPIGTNNAIPPGHPLWIQLVSTNGVRTATFKVGYPHHKFHTFKVQAPKTSSTAGTVFGGEFDLIGVQGDDVTLQIGDSTPFDLARGVAHEIG